MVQSCGHIIIFRIPRRPWWVLFRTDSLFTNPKNISQLNWIILGRNVLEIGSLHCPRCCASDAFLCEVLISQICVSSSSLMVTDNQISLVQIMESFDNLNHVVHSENFVTSKICNSVVFALWWCVFLLMTDHGDVVAMAVIAFGVIYVLIWIELMRISCQIIAVFSTAMDWIFYWFKTICVPVELYVVSLALYPVSCWTSVTSDFFEPVLRSTFPTYFLPYPSAQCWGFWKALHFSLERSIASKPNLSFFGWNVDTYCGKCRFQMSGVGRIFQKKGHATPDVYKTRDIFSVGNLCIHLW